VAADTPNDHYHVGLKCTNRKYVYIHSVGKNIARKLHAHTNKLYKHIADNRSHPQNIKLPYSLETRGTIMFSHKD